MDERNDTILAHFWRRAREDGGRPALSIKRQGPFRQVTWGELASDVRRVAAGLAQRGIKPQDRVAQFSENRYEWIVADLAIQSAGAVHVPLHAPLTGEQAAFQVRHSGAKLGLVSTAEQVAKLLKAGSLPEGVPWLSFEPCKQKLGGQPVAPWQSLFADDDSKANAVVDRALSETTPQTLATILYTSGTTGEPKGVMLSQENLCSNADGALSALGRRQEDLRLTFLPLSHVFARTCDLYTWILSGCQLALAESRETVLADCAAVQPTLLNGVPYFYEKVWRYLCSQGREDQPGALRQALGGAVRICCSGGAALPDYVAEYYASQDVPLLQGYGLSETSPVITTCSEQRQRIGSAGCAIKEVEIRIAEDGEVLTKGPHVMMGYYRDDEATAQTIRDGWLHTGDLGRIDEDGFLYITGRKKEILVTSGGKNVAPVYLESLLTEDPLIEQALVVGDGRNFLSALIVPNPEALKSEMSARKIRAWSSGQALRHPQVLELYQSRIRERLQGVSHYEQVRKFTLLDRGFTIQSGEMTPKLTLRRKTIEQNFADVIDAMYAG